MQDTPNRPEEATMLCVSSEVDKSTSRPFAIRWATPCNGKYECINGEDEKGCESPLWLLPVLLLIIIILICCGQFAFFHRNLRKEIWHMFNKKNLKSKQSMKKAHSKSEKLIHIAILLEQGKVDDIKNIMTEDIYAHGNKAKVLCCFKVK